MTSRPLLASVLRRLRGLVPRRHRLPFWYAVESFAGNCEPELRALPLIAEGSAMGNAIDAGANAGLYSYRLSALYPRVYAFEPLAELTGALEDWGRGVEVRHCALSDRPGSATLYTPVVRHALFGIAHPLLGWTSITPQNHPRAIRQIERTVELRSLDSFDLQDVRFIKIDVEGNELAVLRGATGTLQKWRPTILCEVKAENLASLSALLSGLGYVEKPIADLIGRPATPENHLFVAAEHSERDPTPLWRG